MNDSPFLAVIFHKTSAGEITDETIVGILNPSTTQPLKTTSPELNARRVLVGNR
jgi:hypothetical protein